LRTSATSTTILLAWGICLMCGVFAGLGLLLWLRSDHSPTSMSGLQTGQGGITIAVMYTLTWIEVSVVGALIASRQSSNPIGWLIQAASLLATVQGLANGYSANAAAPGSGGLPGRDALAWLGSWVGAPALGLIVVVLLLFPTGRLQFRWTWLVAWLAATASVVQAVAFALAPGPLHGVPTITNPISTIGAGPLFVLGRDLGTAGLVLSMVASAVLLTIRLRRARGKERQQLKWIAYAAGLFAVGVGALSFAPAAWTALAAGLFALTGAGLTTAVGVAILRYQLFDIDVLINRTLIYGCLIVTLGAAYAGGVLLLQILLSPFTRGSDIAIAASSLGVAALFGPALRRIRDAIDRRFYRRKYDAARTLQAFSGRLREDVDLDGLTADLLDIVQETMQPTQISLWVRPTWVVTADSVGEAAPERH
jgi:hypothetical protein